MPRGDDDYLRAAATDGNPRLTLAQRCPPGSGRPSKRRSDPGRRHQDLVRRRLRAAPGSPTLLGPVGARTHGTAIAKRKPYYTELLTYLATRSHGATPEEVADAFSSSPGGLRVRNDIKVLRDWLGVPLLTGRKHLPDARDSAAAQARGIGIHQVEDLLVDADRSYASGSAENPAAPTASTTSGQALAAGNRAAVRQAKARRVGPGCTRATGSTIT